MQLKTPILLLDGGLGTTLADQYSCTFDDNTPLWSSHLLITSPSTLLAAQTGFADAGADIILTDTYQASFEGFARTRISYESQHDQEDRGNGWDRQRDAKTLMRSAVFIARESLATSDKNQGGGNPVKSKRHGKVALSLGPYGATMQPGQEYSGRYDSEHVTVEHLRVWHLNRIRVFSEKVDDSPPRSRTEKRERADCWEEVDLVAFETLPLLEEIIAVREVMNESCGLSNLGGDEIEARKAQKVKPFWVSCVFPGERNCLPDGSNVRQVIKAMLGKKEGAATPMGVGINCTRIGKIEGLVQEFEAAMRELIGSEEVEEWPSLVVYPDGTNGEVYNTTTHSWEKKKDSNDNLVSCCLLHLVLDMV